MIGLDTSHVIAFTKLINDPQASDELAKVTIAAGYPGGNPEFPLSRDRVEGFTSQLRDVDVEIVTSIGELLESVDAVMLESVDGSGRMAVDRPQQSASRNGHDARWLGRLPEPPRSRIRDQRPWRVHGEGLNRYS